MIASDSNLDLTSVLGQTGFLSTGDKTIRGNMALHDQNMALRWTKDNIHLFGGDPERILLFGESSGATAAHWHFLSKKSQGLFTTVISQTGAATRRYPNTNDYFGQAKYLAQRVGCNLNMTSEGIAKCLKSVDARRIVETHRDAMSAVRNEYATYGPIVENVKDEDSFITQEAEEILSTGNYNKSIKWISGINSADGILFATNFIKERGTVKKFDMLDGWMALLHKFLRYDDVDLEKSRTVAHKIRKYYFGDDLPSDPKKFQNLTNMVSDRYYFLPNYNAVKLQSLNSPTFSYYFDYQTVSSLHKVVDAVEPSLRFIPPELQIVSFFMRSWINENILGNERPFYGAAHGNELFLLFNLNPVLEVRQGTPDYEASLAMVKTWADIARGEITGEDELLYSRDVVWPSSASSKNDSLLQYLHIANNKIEIIDDPLMERMEFWKSLNLTFLGHPL